MSSESGYRNDVSEYVCMLKQHGPRHIQQIFNLGAGARAFYVEKDFTRKSV